MPKKPQQETDAEQSERFRKGAQRLIDAGELNPTEAAEAMDRIVRRPFTREAEKQGGA